MSDAAPKQPQQALDELIAQFEEEVRMRPTPAELAEAERLKESAEAESGAIPEKEPKTAPEVARTPLPDPMPTPVPAPAPVPVPLPEPDPDPVPLPRPLLPPAPPAAMPAITPSVQVWWAAGERVELVLPGGVKRTIFTRVTGDGPWLTMIHGFPTSSYDWAPMVPALAQSHRLLAFDLLGFGDSDKPSGHDWSAFEQADIVEALWRHFGVKETRVVAHDVGLTVSLELLARRQEGRLDAEMTDYTLLNGGVYAEFHRPRRVQVLLQRPVVGFLVAQAMSESKFSQGLAEIFAPGHQLTREELHQQWETVTRRGGSKNYHRLIKYIPERAANKGRWESAVEQSPLPIRFVWGMADPISGAHMVEVVRERCPGADIVEFADVGHYPQLEVPEKVAAAIIEGLRPAPAR